MLNRHGNFAPNDNSMIRLGDRTTRMHPAYASRMPWQEVVKMFTEAPERRQSNHYRFRVLVYNIEVNSPYRLVPTHR